MKLPTLSQRKKLIRLAEKGRAACAEMQKYDYYDDSQDGRAKQERRLLHWADMEEAFGATLRYERWQLEIMESGQ